MAIPVNNSRRLFDSLGWTGPAEQVVFEEPEFYAYLCALDEPVYAIKSGEKIGLALGGTLTSNTGLPVIGIVSPATLESLGDSSFRVDHGVKWAYYAGAMANAIASEEMVITLGRSGLLGSFGAAGLSPTRLEESLKRIQTALPDGPYAMNLINSPNEPAMEQRTAELYVRNRVPLVEASAYMDVTSSLVYYRAAGLSQAADGSVKIGHRIIAKLSRKEVASRFMAPAPEDILRRLVSEGKISEQQAALARLVPMADDITAEADSGGHTDNRPLVNLLPAILTLRDELQNRYQFRQPVRVGAGGGIATPSAALAAFTMGAAFVVTGSVNQACVESGASAYTKKLLSEISMTDVAMAPAADMFEMGVKVQVVRRGTMFAMRAQKLFELYSRYDSLADIPEKEREKLETQIFKRTLDSIWEETVRFFSERDPRQIERAEKDARQKMALVFRWYLGLSSRWSNSGEKGREMDYQIWCGPAMGAFNDWSRGTPLAEPQNRRVINVTRQLMSGAAYLTRLRCLQAQGVPLPVSLNQFRPLSVK